MTQHENDSAKSEEDPEDKGDDNPFGESKEQRSSLEKTHKAQIAKDCSSTCRLGAI